MGLVFVSVSGVVPAGGATGCGASRQWSGCGFVDVVVLAVGLVGLACGGVFCGEFGVDLAVDVVRVGGVGGHESYGGASSVFVGLRVSGGGELVQGVNPEP